jgi:hypothetical protein
MDQRKTDCDWRRARTPRTRQVSLPELHVSICLTLHRELLDVLKYTSEDTLVFAGDLVAKHPSTKASLDTLDLVRSLNASSVRGNHDQYVVFWRAWLEANRRNIEGDLADSTLLQAMEDSLEAEEDMNSDFSSKLSPHPKDWKKHAQHFRIARRTDQGQADFLSSLPLTLYIDRLNAFIVHAGLLPLSAPSSGYVRPTEVEDVALDSDSTEEDALSVLPDQLESRNPAYFTPSAKVHASLRASAQKKVLLVEQNR